LRRITTLAAAAAMLTPLLLGSAGSASATSGNGTLTVTTLGRNGKPVSSTLSVYNTGTHSFAELSSGQAHSLAKGTYQVFADIWSSSDGTDTVGARTLTVSGATRATIDARQGRAVKAWLSPGPGAGYLQSVAVSACSADSPYGASAVNDAGKVFVIPSTDSAFELAYSSTWRNGQGAAATAFVAVGDHQKGLPSGVSTIVRQSSLATLRVSARSGPETGDSQLQLSNSSGTPCMWSLGNLQFDATLPYSFTAHVSPGSWTASEQAQDYLFSNALPYGAGRSYGLTVNSATWGPSGDLPYIWAGQHRLYLNTDQMFTDSALPYGTGFSAAYKLTKGGRTLLSKSLGSNSQATLNPILTSGGWYDLTVSARRSPDRALPSTALSTASSVAFHFSTDLTTYRQIRAYLTRFSPAGLNGADQAAPGAHTTVGLDLQRPAPNDDMVHQLSDSVKQVQAWYSTDGGRSWHAVPVRFSRGAWSASVPDPAAGLVSLRSEVTDSHGDTTTTTVVNAYAVG
jgi:hypothetical protein